MACLGDCWDLGPPPDSILFMPPPPAPVFLQTSIPDLLLNTTPCSSTQICETWPTINRVPDGIDYVELPRKDLESWSVGNLEDTWLLVLVASSIGVLLLGALLAMFLLKCREMNMFVNNSCSMHQRDHRPIKPHESRECTSVNNINSNKLVHPTESVVYHNGIPDNRMVWAALTPRGTQHFISENYPRDLVDYMEPEDHYETVDHMNSVLPPHPPYPTYEAYQKDYDYEDPLPLIENYQLTDVENQTREGFQFYGNADMRCGSLGFGGTLRRGAIPMGVAIRPRVSSPTRIEHPNLPPLNLYPYKGNTLRRNTFTYRSVEAMALPKYGC